MDYKNTLNLPKTDFPMKADLPKREPLMLERWQKEDIFRLIAEKSRAAQKYVLHDGPPYANGNIHIGHALNKTLKDIVVKFKAMRGFNAPYVPGWDCHGLPIEHALLKELKISKHQIGQAEFRKKAHEYAMRFVNIQREQFMRLGVFADWYNPYLTLTPGYEVGILESFRALWQKGYVYRGLKPVNWCFKCETALAEAEVEYEDHVSPSIYVKFLLEENALFDKGVHLLIWTTTPWTLLANVAVAVHPQLNYSCVKTPKGTFVIASELLAHVMEQGGLTEYTLIKEVKGSSLEGLSYTHPFVNRKGKVVLAQYVSREDGTGLVHTAPGHGNEDYMTGVKYKLEVVMPVDNRGKFDESAGEFAGQNVLEANAKIIEKLSAGGALYFDSPLQHSYPHCWRCKSPVILRATNQWFLSLEHEGLRKRLVEAIESQVNWIPASGKERIKAMVELRPDWCLSRQRYWGVPIPSLVCKECGHVGLYAPVVDSFITIVAKEGTDSWFIRPVNDFIPAKVICTQCGAAQFSAGTDILDVWFDSGVSHQAVLKPRREQLGGVPAQLYLEGSDQHRGWFQASLIPSVCIDGAPPFQSVLTHGFVVDGLGRKMSKSMGNVISPEDIIKEYGADILRLWVASSDYNDDIRISKEILTRLSEGYRKVRNTVKFMLSNVYDFNPATDKVEYDNLRAIDKWILLLSDQMLLASVEDAYESFEFYKAYKALYDFCNESLSMYYLDMVKGRLYTSAAKSQERRAAQTAMYEVLNVLVRIMAPLLVFTADEIWQNMPKEREDSCVVSVHLLDWPKRKAEFFKNKANEIALFSLRVIKLIPHLAKALEEKRAAGLIGSSFDARINILTNNQERYTFLSNLQEGLCEIFKVSQVAIQKTEKFSSGTATLEAYPDVAIEVLKAEGAKCARCWNYSVNVQPDIDNQAICNKCSSAIGGK